LIRLVGYLSFAFVIFCKVTILPQDLIKAKVAILHKSGEDFMVLRTNDRLKVGEMIRIFVQPENNCYVYIINSDKNESTLLYDKEVSADKDTLILPSTSEFYIFDDKSSDAKITILCSLKKIDEINKVFKNKSQTDPDSWNVLEEKLLKKYKKNLSDKSEKPFPMAGNVSAVNDEFLERQLTLSGKEALIRKYEIEIKK
jgi:hypothetical protein